ncbi:MAG TPA: AI-2E family transporter [Acetobacteraceae bacterium]|jgi:predicted PurR-regulated permease PerM
MTAERVLMGLLLGGVAVGCTLVLYPFLSALLWAAILTFTTWPVFEWLRVRLHLGRIATAGLMVTITAVVVVLPMALAAPSGADDVNELQHVLQDWLAAGLPNAPGWLFQIPVIGQTLGDLWNTWAADLSVMVAFFKPYFGIAAQFGLGILLGLANGVLLFLLALFAAFFFYASGDVLALKLHIILRRIAGARADRLIDVTGATVRGVVYGLLGTAVVQGILTALGLWVSGVPRPALLGVVAGGLSVLPIGAPTVWIPAGFWLMASGHTFWGIALLVYGGVAVSGADTVIRPYFIARGAQLPFLLTMLGVLGGALAFGLLGIFLGPVLLGVGFALVNEWATIDVSEPPAMPSP